MITSEVLDRIEAIAARHHEAARNETIAVARRAIFILASALADLPDRDRDDVLALLRQEIPAAGCGFLCQD